VVRTLCIVSCVAVLASTARADTSPGITPPPEDLSPGNGVVIALSAFTMNTLTGTYGLAVGTSTASSAFPSLQPLVSIGFQAGQVAALVGFGFGAVGGTGGLICPAAGCGGSGTTFLASVTPTIRFYLRPLQAGSFSPFAEGTVGVGVAGNAPDIALLADVGFGGEWLFMKNFGLFGRAMVGYEHANFGSNVDGIGLAGDIGLTAHL
jgi:hypothetical protein